MKLRSSVGHSRSLVVRYSGASALALIVSASACSSVTHEAIGSSTAAVTVTANNPAVLMNMSETATAVGFTPASGNWHWVTAFNNCSSPIPANGFVQCDASLGYPQSGGLVGWSVSPDLTGQGGWALNAPPPGTEETGAWVPPGNPSGPPGTQFKGYFGDPSLAQISTNGSAPDGSALVLTNVIVTNNSVSPTSDIVALLSTDGGFNFGNPRYISQPAGGGGVDQAMIATNPRPPYSTFAVWTNDIWTGPPTPGWLTSLTISNGAVSSGTSYSAPQTWTGSPIAITGLPSNNTIHPKIAVSTIPWAGTNNCTGAATHEIVTIVYPANDPGRKCIDGPDGGQLVQNAAWNMVIFDNTANAWYGTYHLDADPQWPSCIAMGPNEPVLPVSYPLGEPNANTQLPSVAAMDNFIAVAYNKWVQHFGTKIMLREYSLSCSNDQLNAPQLITVLQAPTWCYPSRWCPPTYNGPNGPNGTSYVINDQWGAQIAFQYNQGVPETIVTYYDTSGDSTNTMAKLRVAVSKQFGPSGSPFGSPFWNGTIPTVYDVSKPNSPGEQVPWNVSTSGWWDYQSIGVDAQQSHTFLASWGGDNRLVSSGGPAGVFTAVITP